MNAPESTAIRRPLGYASGYVDITPTIPVPLAGYGNRTQPFDTIADTLEANAVVLYDGDVPFVFVAFDLLYVGDYLRAALENVLASEVPRRNLFLAASHTHFAPGTDATLPRLGFVDPAYVHLVVERVAGMVRRLLRAAPDPWCGGVGAVPADHAVNRRCLTWRIGRRYPFLHKGVWMLPNPTGPTHDTIGIMRLGANALIWNYACHPVFMPHMNRVSADFVGSVRAALRETYGPQLAVLFWQGFSGNIYPSFASTMVRFSARLKRLLFRTSEAVDPRVWHSWSKRLARHVVEGARTIPIAPMRGPIVSTRTLVPLARLLGPQAPGKQISSHRIRIGSEIHIIGISAELVTEYLPIARRMIGSGRLFCVGCIDGVFGYLPTTAIVQEGGYEADGFFPAFSLRGSFPDDIEPVVQTELFAA